MNRKNGGGGNRTHPKGSYPFTTVLKTARHTSNLSTSKFTLHDLFIIAQRPAFVKANFVNFLHKIHNFPETGKQAELPPVSHPGIRSFSQHNRHSLRSRKPCPSCLQPSERSGQYSPYRFLRRFPLSRVPVQRLPGP